VGENAVAAERLDPDLGAGKEVSAVAGAAWECVCEDGWWLAKLLDICPGEVERARWEGVRYLDE
jgi:hypothetical protein